MYIFFLKDCSYLYYVGDCCSLILQIFWGIKISVDGGIPTKPASLINGPIKFYELFERDFL